jgi:hypothetical protein
MKTRNSVVLSGKALAGYNGQERGDDFYPTPGWATEALLSVEDFAGTILEPACGDGAISKVLLAHGYEVVSSDLVDRGYGIRGDFLTLKERVSTIVTNPPFTLAGEFIKKAKTLTSRKFCFFLKIQFLEGVGRLEMFRDEKFPLARVHVFSSRVTLRKNGVEKGASGTMCFAWFVWDKKHQGPPTINWLSKTPKEKP